MQVLEQSHAFAKQNRSVRTALEVKDFNRLYFLMLRDKLVLLSAKIQEDNNMKKNIETQPIAEQPVDPLRAVCAKSLEKYNDLMDIQDISSALRISKKFAYRLISEGKINSFLVGRKWLTAKEWVIDYLCEQTNVKKGKG